MVSLNKPTPMTWGLYLQNIGRLLQGKQLPPVLRTKAPPPRRISVASEYLNVKRPELDDE